MTRHLNTIHPEEKFENIVDIIKPSMKQSNQINIETEDNMAQQPINCNDNIVIIENKLLQKPFESKDSIIDLPENVTNQINNINEEYPLINQIKVITAVSTYKQEICNNDISDKYNKNLNMDIITDDFNQKSSELQTQFETKSNLLLKQTEHDIPSTEIRNNLHYLSTQNTYNTSTIASTELQKPPEFTNYELPKTQKISSVIRSVGNVKKNLTPLITTPAKPISQSSMEEYKHKKYCRNNYNIDLYRKILGCDEYDDNESDKVKETDQNSIDLKSSTPVHWRKSFKNIYETTSS